MFGEATWEPSAMPLRYDSAPTLVNNFGASDVPTLIHMISDVRRGSPVAQFASKFRSRRQPLPNHVGRELLEVYNRFRADGAAVAEGYEDALPYPPPRIDADREATYRRLAPGPSDWVPLRDLRSALTDVARAALDDTIRQMRRDKRLTLTLEDDQSALTKADRDAALRIGPDDMHYLRMD